MSQQIVAGWKFLTKRDLTSMTDKEFVTYTVVSFEEGYPWIHDGTEPRLRQPTKYEYFWGALVQPGEGWVTVWDRAYAEASKAVSKVVQDLHDMINDPKAVMGDVVPSREMLRSYLELEHQAAAVAAAMQMPEISVRLDALELDMNVVRAMEGR